MAAALIGALFSLRFEWLSNWETIGPCTLGVLFPLRFESLFNEEGSVQEARGFCFRCVSGGCLTDQRVQHH